MTDETPNDLPWPCGQEAKSVAFVLDKDGREWVVIDGEKIPMAEHIANIIEAATKAKG